MPAPTPTVAIAVPNIIPTAVSPARLARLAKGVNITLVLVSRTHGGAHYAQTYITDNDLKG